MLPKIFKIIVALTIVASYTMANAWLTVGAYLTSAAIVSSSIIAGIFSLLVIFALWEIYKQGVFPTPVPVILLCLFALNMAVPVLINLIAFKCYWAGFGRLAFILYDLNSALIFYSPFIAIVSALVMFAVLLFYLMDRRQKKYGTQARPPRPPQDTIVLQHDKDYEPVDETREYQRLLECSAA